MTDKYRSELFSRIRKLNFTNTVVVRQVFHLFLLFSAFFIFGFLFGYLIEPGKAADSTICDFFCTDFTDLGFWGSVEQIFLFSSSDFRIALIILLSGYTMMASPISALCLSYMGVKSGYCFSNLWRILIYSGKLSGGGATFAYISVCKFCVLITVIFLAVWATDFSYRYSELYRKFSRPLMSPQSANYALVALSSSGVTVLINSLFLIFQFISPSAPG